MVIDRPDQECVGTRADWAYNLMIMTLIHEQPELDDRVRQLLASHGVTVTTQRVKIGHILFARPRHLSAEQILEELTVETARVSKATVYNTLNLFVEKGLVRPVHIDGSRILYDSTTKPHHHILNVDTGELTDVSAEDLAVQNLPALPEGTVADGVEVLIRVRNEPQV